MANSFNAYTQAKNAALSQGAQMMAMEELAQKNRRDRAVRNALSQSYQSPQSAITLPHSVEGPVRPEVPGGMNWENAMSSAAKGDVVPEMMQLQAGLAKNKPEWAVTEQGAEGGLTQRVAYNKNDPTQIRPLGKPYQKKGGTTVNVGMGKGFKKVDETFAKEYVDFKASGGFSDIQKSLTQLEQASQALETETLTGPLIGSVPDWAKKFSKTGRQAISIKEGVEEVVQRNLRLILGPQFTEKEGERLIARAYNPNLDEATNKQRIDRLLKQIKDAALAKQEAISYFDQNGTLEGFTGKVYTKADFENLYEETTTGGPKRTGPKKGTIKGGYIFMGGDASSPDSWKKQ